MAMTACAAKFCKQLDLLVGERANFLAIDRKSTDQFIILEHWHVDRGPRTAEFDRRARNAFGGVIRCMTHLLCPHDAIEMTPFQRLK